MRPITNFTKLFFVLFLIVGLVACAQAERRRLNQFNNLTVTNDLALSGAIDYTGFLEILATTADGSDTGGFTLGAGGAASPGRGPYVQGLGDDNTSAEGWLYITTGADASASMRLRSASDFLFQTTGGADIATFDSGGLTMAAGANIFLANTEALYIDDAAGTAVTIAQLTSGDDMVIGNASNVDDAYVDFSGSMFVRPAGTTVATFDSGGLTMADGDTIDMQANANLQWYQGGSLRMFLKYDTTLGTVFDSDAGIRWYPNNTYSAFLTNAGTDASTSFRMQSGSAATPAYSFIDDTNTGMYSISADAFGFATAGTLEMTINNGYIQVDAGTQFILPNYNSSLNNASSPSLYFSGDFGTGIYNKANGTIGFSSDSSEVATFDTGGLVMADGADIEGLGNRLTIKTDATDLYSDMYLEAEDDMAFILGPSGIFSFTVNSTNYFRVTDGGVELPQNDDYITFNDTGGDDAVIGMDSGDDLLIGGASTRNFDDIQINAGDDIFFASDGSLRWTIDQSGDLFPGTNGGPDLGNSGAGVGAIHLKATDAATVKICTVNDANTFSCTDA